MNSRSLAFAVTAALATSLASTAVHAGESVDGWTDGPLQLRLRGVHLGPDNGSDAMTRACVLPQTCAGALPANQVKLDSKFYPEVDGEWYFNPHLSTELALALPQKLGASVAGMSWGGFKLMPDTLTLKYTFMPAETFRPYVGIGAHYSSLTSRSLAVPTGSAIGAGPLQLDGLQSGWVAQAGFEVRIVRSWFLNADARYLGGLDPDLKSAGSRVGGLNINPLLLSVGIGYRFGGSQRAAAAPVVAAAAPVLAPVVAPPPAPVVAAPAPVLPPAPRPPLDSDGDGVPDSIDQCPATPRGTTVDAFGCPCDITQEVHFATDSAALTAEDKLALDRLVPELQGMHFANGEVAGYTDSRGSDAHNQKLSERRAQAVAGYLKAKGLTAGRISVVGFGEKDPVADNATDAGRAHNRRVVLRRTDCHASSSPTR